MGPMVELGDYSGEDSGERSGQRFRCKKDGERDRPSDLGGGVRKVPRYSGLHWTVLGCTLLLVDLVG